MKIIFPQIHEVTDKLRKKKLTNDKHENRIKVWKKNQIVAIKSNNDCTIIKEYGEKEVNKMIEYHLCPHAKKIADHRASKIWTITKISMK